MKRALLALGLLVLTAKSAEAGKAPKSALDNDPDLFAVVTPGRLLGNQPRRQWLTLWSVNGREYWAAWDCRGKPCDTERRVRERAASKPIALLPTDPKPADAERVQGAGSK